MTQLPHKERLRKEVLEYYMKQRMEFTEKIQFTHRLKYWLGATSLISATAVLAVIAVSFISTSKPESVHAMTAEQLLSDARTQFQQIIHLQPGEIYHLSTYTTYPSNEGSREYVYTESKEYWTDGRQYREDVIRQGSPYDAYSEVWMLDSASSGQIYRYSNNIITPSLKEKMVTLPEIISYTFHDYPANGSILDTKNDLADIIRLSEHLEFAKIPIEQTVPVQFFIQGEEVVANTPVYHVVGYSIGSGGLDSLATQRDIEDVVGRWEYWISIDDHRLVQERFTLGKELMMETIYSPGEVINDPGVFDVKQIKQKYALSEKVPVKKMQQQVFVSPAAFSEVNIEVRRMIIQEKTLLLSTIDVWQSCVNASHDPAPCNQKLLEAFHDKQTFMVFCDNSEPAICEQQYTDFEAVEFDSEKY